MWVATLVGDLALRRKTSDEPFVGNLKQKTKRREQRQLLHLNINKIVINTIGTVIIFTYLIVILKKCEQFLHFLQHVNQLKNISH